MLQASQPADGSTRCKNGTYLRDRISRAEHLHTASQGTEELQWDGLDMSSVTILDVAKKTLTASSFRT
jgi:hypothetical protein